MSNPDFDFPLAKFQIWSTPDFLFYQNLEWLKFEPISKISNLTHSRFQFSKGKIENLEYSRFSFLPLEYENLEYSRFKQNSKSGVTKIMKLPLKRLKFHLLQIFIFKRQNCESGVLQNLIFLLQNFKSGVLQIFIFIEIWSE